MSWRWSFALGLQLSRGTLHREKLITSNKMSHFSMCIRVAFYFCWHSGSSWFHFGILIVEASCTQCYANTQWLIGMMLSRTTEGRVRCGMTWEEMHLRDPTAILWQSRGKSLVFLASFCPFWAFKSLLQLSEQAVAELMCCQFIAIHRMGCCVNVDGVRSGILTCRGAVLSKV